MPPTRRTRRVGLKRIDAALDAVLPMGFPAPLVRRTVRTLLKAYGGDEGWTFIEEGSYKLLVDTILEELEKSEREKNEPKLLLEDEPKLLIENGLPKDEIMQDEAGVQVHSPDVHSKRVQSPRSRSPPPVDVMPYPLKNETPHETHAVQVHSQKIDTAHAPSSPINSPPTMGIVPCFVKDVIQFSSSKISSEGVHFPQSCSPSRVDCLPLRRRKPCYGWLSSDDEEEPDLVYLTPAV